MKQMFGSIETPEPVFLAVCVLVSLVVVGVVVFRQISYKMKKGG